MVADILIYKKMADKNKMFERVFFIVLLSLAVLPGVFAVNTIVNLDSDKPDHNVTLNVLDPNDLDSITQVMNNTDSSGDAVFVFELNSKRDISFSVLIRKNGKIVSQKQFDNYVSGEVIDLELKDGPKPSAPKIVEVKNISNVSSVNESSKKAENSTSKDSAVNVTASIDKENESKKNTEEQKITGSVSVSGAAFKSKYLYYILGVIVIAAAVFFVMRAKKTLFSFSSPFSFTSASNSSGAGSKEKASVIKDRELADAERKIKEAQEEIRKIRERSSKVAEAERKFNEAKKELDRLKR